MQDVVPPQELPQWAVGALAVMSVVFGFVKWLWPRVARLRATRATKKDVDQTTDALRKHGVMYGAIQALHDHGVQRCVIFVGHNGGGIPHPGTPFYVSALHWAVESRDRHAPQKYQHLPVDCAYIELLRTIAEQGSARFKVDEMPACQLRDIYASEGVTDALIVFLGIHGRKIYFMSAAVFDGELSEGQITEAKLQANIISDLIKPD